MGALLLAASVSADNLGYSFISGSDIRDALTQDSMVVQGYVLGVADALKGQEGSCFQIPLAADADQALYQAYLDYWQGRGVPTQNGVHAIQQALQARFPCDAKP